MRLDVVTPPATLPVSLVEAKAWLRETSSHEDALIAQLIGRATREVEAITSKAIINRTLRLRQDRWPLLRCIRLPMPPLVSVSAVEYLDGAGVLTTMSSSLYTVSTAENSPGRIVLKSGSIWPLLAEEPDAVRVTFVAGYGADASTVPEAIKEAISILVEDGWDSRGALVSSNDARQRARKVLAPVTLFEFAS